MGTELADGTIVLRVMTLDDAQALADGEDEDAVRWLTGGPGTLETAGAHISASLEQWRIDGPRRAWGIYDQATGMLAGTAEAHFALDGLAEDEANISYSVFPAFRGRRYAVRAVDLVCRWLAEATDKTTAVLRIDPRNTYSAQISGPCGFTEQGMALTPDGEHLMKYVRNLR